MRPETGNQTVGANSEKPLNVGASNYLYCYDQDGLLEVTLKKGATDIEVHMMERFTLLRGKDFDNIIVRDKSGSSNTFRLFHGKGDYIPSADRAVVIVDDTTPVETTIENADPIPVSLESGSVTLNQSNLSNGAGDTPDVSITAATTVQVVTASADNVRVRVTNLADNTQTMRIGCNAAVDAGTGTPLAPGDTWETFTQAGVWVYNPGGSAELVAVEVETRT